MVVVGQIGSAYGIKGWVHVHSYTDPPSNIITYSPWFVNPTAEVEAPWREVEQVQARSHGKGLVASLSLAEDRNEAELLKGLKIGVRRTDLPIVEQGSFYWVDLIGTAVYQSDGTRIGELEDCLDNGAHGVLKVRDDADTHLIPFVSEYVQSVEAGNRIVVDWDLDWE